MGAADKKNEENEPALNAILHDQQISTFSNTIVR